MRDSIYEFTSYSGRSRGRASPPLPPPLYFRPRYLFVTDVNLLLRDSINLQVYPYIKCTSSCQTLHEGFYLQVVHKYSRLKSAKFAGFSREKSQNSRRNRPILRDFRGRKVKIRRKIGRLRGILAEKSQISKDFQGQIVRKIGRCHGKFRGETSPRNNQ